MRPVFPTLPSAAALLLSVSVPAAAAEPERESEEESEEDSESEEDPVDARLRALEARIEQLEAELRAARGQPAPVLPEAGEDSAQAERADEPAPSEEELAEIEALLGGGDEPGPAPPVQVRPPVSPATFLPDLGFVADVALAWFSSDEPLQTGAHDPRGNGFVLQQLELSAGKAVDPYFRLDANLVFTPFGVEIEEAYATTLGLPLGLQFRLGQFLTRFGRHNPTHPHTWLFVDQPFAVGRVFGGEGNRGAGIEGSILLPLPWYVEVVGSGTMAGGASTALSFLGGEGGDVKTPLDLQGVVAIKQFFELSPDVSLLWGLSWATGPNPTGRDNRTEVYGTDLTLKVRPIRRAGDPRELSVETEWLHRRRQVPGDVLADWSGFAQLFFRFAPRWAVAARYEYGSPVFTSEHEPTVDPLDPEWTDHRHRVSVNGTLWPTEFSRVRLQAGVDVPRWRERPDVSVMLSFEFAMGAHGAHSF